MSASREKRLRRELRDAEANSDTRKKQKKQKNKKPMTQAKAKKIRSAIGSAVAIVLVVLFIGLIFVNSGLMQTHATALTVGSHKLTPTEFNYAGLRNSGGQRQLRGTEPYADGLEAAPAAEYSYPAVREQNGSSGNGAGVGTPGS